MRKPLRLTVNGETHEIMVDPRQMLLEVLRDELGLTGTKEGCGNGNCGSCTVLLDGKAVNSCLVFALEAEGHQVLTIEGLSANGALHPLQQAFIENGALQCGFCTPGFILSAKALLDKNPRPTELESRKAIGGNLCRCNAYNMIVRAIQAAARQMETAQ